MTSHRTKLTITRYKTGSTALFKSAGVTGDDLCTVNSSVSGFLRLDKQSVKWFTSEITSSLHRAIVLTIWRDRGREGEGGKERGRWRGRGGEREREKEGLAFFYLKQPLRVPEERNVRPCEELALPQPTKFGFRSQEDEQTSCTKSRLTLVLSMRERARLGLDEIHKVAGKNMPTVA